jgi:hypothetical protein
LEASNQVNLLKESGYIQMVLSLKVTLIITNRKEQECGTLKIKMLSKVYILKLKEQM